jgi:hypothetical protein
MARRGPGQPPLLKRRPEEDRSRLCRAESDQFTQKDPIGIAGGMNLYGFAGGDPVNFSDPFGLAVNCDFTTGEGCSEEVKRLITQDRPLESPIIDPIALLSVGVASVVRGIFARLTTGAVESSVTSGVRAAPMQAMERQLATAGRSSVEKTIRTLTRRVAEHEVKIAKAAAEGGKTSSMEREIRAMRETIRAAESVLGRNP